MSIDVPKELPTPVDEEPVAAHVYRDGRIIHTIIIECTPDEDGVIWYTAYPDGYRNRPIVQRPSMDEVQNLMDHYLQGFAQAYDEALEEPDPHAACKRHRYDSPEDRATGRCSRCRQRAATRPRLRRDRANVEGASQSNRPD